MMDILHRIMFVSIQIFTVLVLMISLHRDAWQVRGQICNTPGWLDYGNSQYLIVNEVRTWGQAKEYCKTQGGHLAIITSHEQTDFLVTHTLKSTYGYSYWIGLHDSDGDGLYTWIDDTQPEYSNWSPLQPLTNLRCVRMRSTHSVVDQGEWRTRSCSEQGVHICQRPKDSRCSWHPFGQSFYRFYGEARSYDDGRTNCMSNGGDLAIIKSEELNNFLVGFISTSNPSNTCYWLGLSSDKDNDNFVWVDGTEERRNESSWNAIEPNNGNDAEYCACIIVNIGNERHGKWNDIRCSNARPYICERPQVKSDVWIDYPNVQYYMPPFSASYFDAMEYCQQFGGSLAQPKTSEIDTNITNGFEENFWFGLDALHKEGLLQWADGTFLRNSRFNKWKAGTPDNLQGYEFCVAHVNGSWDDLRCNETHRFVCEKSKGCPPRKWNIPICDRLCNNCYNGGVCNPQTGACICTPGFTGKNCLTACGAQMFGSECTYECGSDVVDDSSCSGNMVCLLDPTECNCLAGYTGDSCNETCSGGKFGSECLQDCHCIDGTSCDVFTGTCEGGCKNGWSGEGCQVPPVCPIGYFGANCTDHCNCLKSSGCEKDSGICIRSEGQCEVGFTSDSVDIPDSCNSFTGCFDTCSRTCHCRGGEDDCNPINGSCSSGRCHPRWRGENCEIDRFQITREKTNPGIKGIATFSCAISFDSPTNVEPGFVKATTGNFSMDNWKIAKDPPQNISSTLLNFTFSMQEFPDDSPIYCFFGNPFNKSSEFGYAKLASAAFYELPTLLSPPMLVASSHYWVVVSWRPWNRSIDTGDGPITGYIVYVHTEDGNETHIATLLPDGSLDTGSSRVKREVTSEDLDLLEYNITGLEDGTSYEIQIAVIREGLKGEGDRGRTLSVKTQVLLPMTVMNGGGSAAIGPIAGGAIGGLLLMLCLVVIIILLLRRKRNRHDNVGKRSPPPQPVHNDYTSQEKLEADEELGRSGPSPSISSRTPGRPAVSPKRLTLAAGSSDARDREDAGVPSVSSPESGPKERHPIPLADFSASVQKKSSRNLDRPAISPKRLTLATSSPEAMDREDAGVPSVSHPESGPKERHPIPLSDFPAFVQKNRHSTFFQEEFNDLPEANILPQTVAKKEINFEKNRYKNILPYDSSRVQLAIVNNDPDTDYFNASFIPSFQQPRRYIASQGPNKASMDDFWRMVWQENVATIVMVTNLSEGNKIKCRQYWPETSTTPLLFGDITVELESVEKCSGGSKRSFVLRKGKELRFLNQFHYTKWPDRDVPRNMSSLLNFISEVKKDHEQNNSPLLIHCSAGVGRTGVLITIDSVVSEAKRNKLVDIFGFVSKIRQNRPNMVQTKEQYKFVHEAVLEYLLSENTAIPVNHFTSRLARLRDIDRNSKGRRTGMSVQFESIKILCPDPPANMIRNGTTDENKPKSRYGNSLPTRMNRVILRSVNTQSSDFINASFVRGNHGRFISTEMPMPNTLSDFWVMILDYQPTAIIMLNDDNQRDKSCARYWFDNGMATFGYLSVLTLSTTLREGFIQRTLEVSRGDKVRHVVEQYQFLDWPVDVIKQKKSARSLLKLIEEMREVYSTQNESPLVVHCLNGVGRTAVFCTVLECISQIIDEDVVNVFQTVKMMRNDRMHFVQTEEEYSLIHMLINEYVKTNDYEQLPCADNDEHTYGNLDCAARPAAVESVYELTEIEAGATAYPSRMEERNASEDEEPQQAQAKTTEGETVYENFAYER